MSSADECRVAAEGLVGETITRVSYVGLGYEPDDGVAWDFDSWHHPEVGVELTTVSGRSFYAIWDSEFGEFELTFAKGSIGLEWIPSQEGTARTWEVTDHPRWRPLLREPITEVEISTVAEDPPPRDVPVAVRVANPLTELWIVAAGPQHPPVAGPPSPDTIWLPFDEILVLFDRADALSLGLTGQSRPDRT